MTDSVPQIRVLTKTANQDYSLDELRCCLNLSTLELEDLLQYGLKNQADLGASNSHLVFADAQLFVVAKTGNYAQRQQLLGRCRARQLTRNEELFAKCTTELSLHLSQMVTRQCLPVGNCASSDAPQPQSASLPINGKFSLAKYW